jgi:hypothetical protein
MESMKKNRQQLDQTIAQQREKAREMMETHQQSLKKLLSADQLDKYKTMMRDKMREGMQGLKRRTGNVEQRPPAGSKPSLDRRPPLKHRPPPPNGTTGEPRPDTL